MQEPTIDTTPAAGDDAAATLLEQIRNVGASSNVGASTSSADAPLGDAGAGGEAPAPAVALPDTIDAEAADYIAALEARIAELEGHPGERRVLSGDGGNPVTAEVVPQVGAGDPWGAGVHGDTREPTDAAEVDATHTAPRVDPLAPHLDSGSGEESEAAEVTAQVPALASS